MNVPQPLASSGAAGSTVTPTTSLTQNPDSTPQASASGGQVTPTAIAIPTLSIPVPQAASPVVPSSTASEADTTTTPNSSTPTVLPPNSKTGPSRQLSNFVKLTSASARRTPSASASARRPTRAGGQIEPLVRLGTPSRFSPLHVEVQMGPSTIAPGGADSSARSTPVAGDAGSHGGVNGGTAVGGNAAGKGGGTTLVSSEKPWRHPDELEYICRQDWTQETMITYLSQNVFSIPPSEKKLFAPLEWTVSSDTSPNTTRTESKPYPVGMIPTLAGDPRLVRVFTEIAASDGSTTLLPKGYRVPLMFVAKFQWESLRLVLTSGNPKSEWEEYRFDVVHLSRLCSHLLRAAKEATTPDPKSTAPHISPKADRVGSMDRTWRCGRFDRALTRFYRRWMICREWSVKLFFEEFGEEEYAADVIKHDWPRWVLKGHKGFVLTKDEVETGITGAQFTAGLALTKPDTWTWDNDAFAHARDHRPWPVSPPSLNHGDRDDVQVTSISAGPITGESEKQGKTDVQVKKETIEQSLKEASQVSAARESVPYMPIVTEPQPSIIMDQSRDPPPTTPAAPVSSPPAPSATAVAPHASPAPAAQTPPQTTTPSMPPLSTVNTNKDITPLTTPPVTSSTTDVTRMSKENQTSALASFLQAAFKESGKEKTALAGTKRNRDQVDDSASTNGTNGSSDAAVVARETTTDSQVSAAVDGMPNDDSEGRAAKKLRPDSPPNTSLSSSDSDFHVKAPTTTANTTAAKPTRGRWGSWPPKRYPMPGCFHMRAPMLGTSKKQAQAPVHQQEEEGEDKDEDEDEESESEKGEEDKVGEKEGSADGVQMDVDVGAQMDVEPVFDGEKDAQVKEKLVEEPIAEKEITPAPAQHQPSPDMTMAPPGESPTIPDQATPAAQPLTVNTSIPLSTVTPTTTAAPTPTVTTPKAPRHLSATQQLLAKPTIRRDSSHESGGSGKGTPPPGTPSTVPVTGSDTTAPALDETDITPVIPDPPSRPLIRGGITPRRLGPASRNLMSRPLPRLASNSPKVLLSAPPASKGTIDPSDKEKATDTAASTVSAIASTPNLSQLDRDGLSALETVLSSTVGTQLGGAVRKILDTLSKIIRENQRVVLERLPSTGGVVAMTPSGTTKTVLDPETAQILEALIGLLEGNNRISGMVEAVHASSTDSFAELKGLLNGLQVRLEKAEQAFTESHTSSSSQLISTQAEFQRSQNEIAKRHDSQNAEVVKVAGAIQGTMKNASDNLVGVKRDVADVGEKLDRVVNVVSQGLEGLKDDMKKMSERLKRLEERPAVIQATVPVPSAGQSSRRVTVGENQGDEEMEEDSTSAPRKKGNPVLVRKVMDVMRNMADILEYSDETPTTPAPVSTALTVVNPNSKGKERATGTRTSSNNSSYSGDMALTQPGGSMLFSAILDEMRGIRDELRSNDKRGREELATLRLLHGAEMESIRKGVRESEESARRDTQKWIDERLDAMVHDRMARISSSSVGGNTTGHWTTSSNAELIELRRRLEYLESKQRQEVESPAASASPVERRRERSSSIASSSNDTPLKDLEAPPTSATPSSANGVNTASASKVQSNTSRDWEQPPPVPMRHLNGFGSGIRGPFYGGSASAGPSRKSSLSNVQGSTDGISTPPLPVKSQRKAMMALARQPPAE